MNTTILKFTTVMAFLMLLAGCDLSGIEQATDDFDLIIELQEINTTVAAQVIDTETLETINNVDLTFGGQDAGVLIDVYSDPISEVDASAGVATFGIENAVLPTETSPVEFTVTAAADGYFTETIAVAVADSGGNSVTVRLLPDNVNATVEGTSGVENTQTDADATSGVQQAVTVTTPQQANVQATTQASIKQGTKPLSADGTPLTGQLTTKMRVFDLEQGLTKLPAQHRPSGDEALIGATLFGLSDAGGNHAFDFEAAEGEACAFEMTNETDNADLYALVENGTLSETDVVVSSLDGETDIEVGSVPLSLGTHPTVVATICVGGTDANVDMTEVRAAAASSGKVGAASGIIRSESIMILVRIGLAQAGRLTTLTVDNSANASARTITYLFARGSLGQYIDHTGFTVAGGQSRTVPVNTRMREGSNVRVSAYLGTGEVVEASQNVPASDFTMTLALPTTQAQAYTVAATLSCPSGQKLSPQITANSFSGLSLGFRPTGQRAQFAAMGKARNIQVTESSVSAEAQASLIPGTTYQFRAIYGDATETRQATAASGSNRVTIDLAPSELSGIDCE